MIKFKLKFLLIFLAMVFLCLGYVGWERGLVTSPQSLPERSAIAGNPSLTRGTYYEISIPPPKGAKYTSSDYRLWIPDRVSPLRGLIVKQHGCGDQAALTGLDHANDLQWQALATKHGFGLVGAKYLTGNQVCDEWAEISRGSGDTFLKAIQSFSQQSQHPELAQVPWALWGHSGGSDWSVQILQKYPDRVIAVVGTRCGASVFPDTLSPATSSAIAQVPLLFAVAQKENLLVDECRDLPKQVFRKYRQAGAVWAIAEDANSAHESGDTRLLAIPYLDAIITARLPTTGTQLRSLDAAQAWLGNPTTRTVEPVKQFKDNPLEAVWLPNQETAQKWKEYVTTGKISPTQKPISPTDLKLTPAGDQKVILTWNYLPDLENGLPLFRVYRNNTLIKTLRGQEFNYGDAPILLRVALEFQDPKRPENSVYTIAAFNSLGETVSQPIQAIK